MMRIACTEHRQMRGIHSRLRQPFNGCGVVSRKVQDTHPGDVLLCRFIALCSSVTPEGQEVPAGHSCSLGVGCDDIDIRPAQYMPHASPYILTQGSAWMRLAPNPQDK